VRKVVLALILSALGGGTAHASAVSLEWDPSPGSGVAGYAIRFGVSSGAHIQTIDVGLVTRFKIEGLANRTVYYFVVEAYNGTGVRSSASDEVSAVALDDDEPRWDGLRFKAGGAVDLAVWRPGTGMWHIRRLVDGVMQDLSFQWGAGSLHDVPVPGDYDGDGLTDLAVWRPGDGVWYIRTSGSGYGQSFTIQWGTGSRQDVPVPADYDGDGRIDIAVWRPADGMWHIRTSRSDYQEVISMQWGAGVLQDVPVPGDCDGDGRFDLAVWRPATGTWHIRRSSTDYATAYSVQWGAGVLRDLPLAVSARTSR
jgi:hypothetical protein